MTTETLYRPTIYNLNDPDDMAAYQRVMSEHLPVVMDRIEAQIEELLLSRNPLMSREQIREENLVHAFHQGDMQYCGRWVYYPWSNEIIHLLDSKAFIELRTDRNRNKITAAQQKLFGQKTVGIAGLSVGRSTAMTMATERLLGKLVLADFDEIELSNLNRIKAPLRDLGLNKAVSIAREIAMLDPYLEIECYTDGLTNENMPSFFEGLDLFIEECDDLLIKIESRLYARSKQIPVIMESSDRCLVDIERFDLEPDRPILHGILDDNDIQAVGSVKSFDEKLKLMSKIVDVSKVSEGMLRSLPEIGKTLRTWPQLASEVTLGGGVMSKIVRGILDNSITSSGRYYLDPVERLKNHD